MWLLGMDWSVQGWECWGLVRRKLGLIQIGLWLMLVVITSADNIYSKMVQCQRSSIHREYCFRNCAALIDASYHVKRKAVPAQDPKKCIYFWTSTLSRRNIKKIRIHELKAFYSIRYRKGMTLCRSSEFFFRRGQKSS